MRSSFCKRLIERVCCGVGASDAEGVGYDEQGASKAFRSQVLAGDCSG